MSQQPIELILVRHLASRLVVPVFLVNEAGDLVYFNEPAERILGRRFDEIRAMPFEEWTTAFLPSTGGEPMPVDELPLVIALRQRVPAHSRRLVGHRWGIGGKDFRIRSSRVRSPGA